LTSAERVAAFLSRCFEVRCGARPDQPVTAGVDVQLEALVSLLTDALM
jgi:hypothetical protein